MYLSLRRLVVAAFILLVLSACLQGMLAVTTAVRSAHQVAVLEQDDLVPTVSLEILSQNLDHEKSLLTNASLPVEADRFQALHDELDSLDTSITTSATRILSRPVVRDQWRQVWSSYEAARAIYLTAVQQRRLPSDPTLLIRLNDRFSAVQDLVASETGKQLNNGQRLYARVIVSSLTSISLSILAFGIALIGGGGLAIVIARRLTHGLDNLTSTARAITQGRVSVRANAGGRDEIAAVATAFNHMTDVILTAEKRAEADALLIRTVVSSAPVLLFALDRQGVITFLEGQSLSRLNILTETSIGTSIYEVFQAWPDIVNAVDRALHGEMLKTIDELEALEVTFETRWMPVFDEAGQVARVIGVAVDISERVRMERAMRQVREMERRRIARDLHDDVLQNLAYAAQVLQINQATQEIHAERQTTKKADEVHYLIEAVKSLRVAIYDLRQQGVEEQTLKRMVEAVIESLRLTAPTITIDLVVTSDFPTALTGQACIELTHIIQEALVNVRRHSAASHVTVTLGGDENSLCVSVADNGQGFLHEGREEGFGLTGMRERAHILAGDIHVQSQLGQGTCVQFTAPLAAFLELSAKSLAKPLPTRSRIMTEPVARQPFTVYDK